MFKVDLCDKMVDFLGNAGLNQLLFSASIGDNCKKWESSPILSVDFSSYLGLFPCKVPEISS